MKNLNDRQRAAVMYCEGPLLVLAGAGSGKTRVISQKIVHLINTLHISPTHICAVTFTNKAANEMKLRVRSSIKAKTRGLQISTFHTLGLKILKKHISVMGYKDRFSIFDPYDTGSLIKEILLTDRIQDPDIQKSVQRQISNWKNQLLLPDELTSSLTDESGNGQFVEYYRKYQRYLKAYNAVDLDDLLLMPVKLFENRPDVLQIWHKKIHYLLVDEYQDTNAAQYLLVKQLVGVQGRFTVVGDDDQSIYTWRGAHPENLKLLQKDYYNLQVIKLEQNYRSTNTILTAANQLIANNPHIFDKSIWSSNGEGERIRIFQAKDEEHEAQWLIGDMVHNRFRSSRRYGDYAVLFRSNHQSRLFEKCLREHRIPYFVSGGTSFFASTEIKDLMAYFRLIVNNDDDRAFLRIINTPKRKIGASTLEKLGEYSANRNQSLYASCFEIGLQQFLPEKSTNRLRNFSDWIAKLNEQSRSDDSVTLVNTILNDLDYQSWLEEESANPYAAQRRWENVLELVDWLRKIDAKENETKSFHEIVSHLALVDLLDQKDDSMQDDRVCLMTMHAAKGLEFPVVYISGVEENILPHRESLIEDRLHEERRLLYVGITRAQVELTLSFCAKRRKSSEYVAVEPSRFLAELPQQCVEWMGGEATKPKEVTQETGLAHLAHLKGILGGSQ